MRSLPFLLVITALSFGVACGDDDGHTEHADAGHDCTMETRADTWSIGLEKTGSNGYKVRVTAATPMTPQKGDQTWTLQVENGAGTVVDGATVKVTPMMPDHGHGTPVKAEVTATGSDGKYDVTPVNLWMPGYWRVDVEVTDGSNTDTIDIGVCIDQ